MGNGASNAINILNQSTNELSGVLEAPAGAGNMVLTPDGAYAFLSIAAGSGTAGQIAVISTATGKVVPQSLNLYPQTMAASPDSTEVIAATAGNSGAVTLNIIDVATLTVTATVPTPFLYLNGLLFSPDGTYYYLSGVETSNQSLGTVAYYQTADNSQVSIQQYPAFDGELTISPDGSTLYAGNGAVTVKPIAILSINSATLAIIAQSGEVAMSRGMVPSLDGSTVYTIGPTGTAGVFSLNAVNSSTLAIVKSLIVSGYADAGGAPMLALFPDGTELYVSDAWQTIVVDAATLSVTGTSPVPARTPYQFVK
jgi:DNA-binding beta-propeller fold protein YncE